MRPLLPVAPLHEEGQKGMQSSCFVSRRADDFLTATSAMGWERVWGFFPSKTLPRSVTCSARPLTNIPIKQKDKHGFAKPFIE